MSKKIKDAEIIFAEETLQDAYGPLWETMPEEKKKQLIEDFISRFRKQQQKEEKPNSEKSSEPTKNELQPVYAWDLYRWCSTLTSEQDFNKRMYYWTPEAKKLLNRLKYGEGQLIAVIGFQGSGKNGSTVCFIQ